ncbi:type II toxin-antitoxin system HicA family toxin [Legionella pneumophila]|uniref:type II toxin-antitoxin system HicA family toxin n=1 Tax=Legionella pneumophila TaxID=446 RepID=UPI00399CC2CE
MGVEPKFIAHLESYRCSLKRNGGNHDIYQNDLKPHLISSIPRHNQINPYTADKICKDLEVPKF